MKWLAAILVLAVFTRHNSAFWMAAALDTTPPAVSYVMGATLEVIAGGSMALLALAYASSLWRNLVIFAGIVMMSEGAQMVACRIAIPDIRALPPMTTLCDHVTGLPVAAVATTVYLFLLAYILGAEIARR